MKKQTKTCEQWLELLENLLNERTTTNKKVRIVAISCEPIAPWLNSITLEFNTYTHSPETGEKIPSTCSISEGEVGGAETFSSLVEEIFDRWDNKWK
jgi:hypothetical protein